MLRGGIPLGRVFGIYIRLHYSWFLIFALITWTLAAVYFPATYPSWTLAMKIGAGLLTSLLYFASVLIHELSHSLVAIREGIQIQSITLFFLGGVSQMTGEPKTAGDEFRMAGAGPLSSFVLGGIFIAIYFAARNTAVLPAQFVSAVAFYLGYINIFLGIFNLIPGFPLDGGRVFRSIVWWRTKSLQRATRIASNIGRAFGYLFIFGGIFLVFTGNLFNGIWLALIGWFLESAAVGSYSQLLLQDTLKGHAADEIMSRDCTVVPPDITIELLVNEYMLSSGRRCYPVALGDRALGLITLSDVKAVRRDDWGTTRVREVMTPLDKLKHVSPKEDLSTVLKILAENDINQVPVIDDGNIVGMVARDNIVNFVHLRQQLNK
jgi:Zn-dependent protease/predicted transcriptional regulator